MTDFFLLYVWMKLDEVRTMLENSYGITVLTFIIVGVLTYIWTSTAKDEDGEVYPFSGCFSADSDIKKKCVSRVTRWLKVVACVLVLQIFLNIGALLLPSTKQAAVLYVLHTGVHSETFNTIKSLDADIAQALREKAKEWLHKSVVPAKKAIKKTTDGKDI